MTFVGLLYLLLVVFAFGFVIFWHELGHFLAARWAGVRVEQFAVGMGQAIVSWRKGIGARFAGFGKNGWHWGSTQDDFERLTNEEWARRHGSMPGDADPALSLRERYDIASDLGIGETEYRISWIPLGGYVKPTGQDDLRPAQEVAAGDPKAFGAKPVGKRMVIISAGVVMNVILAFFLYILLFMIGFNAPPAIVGNILPGSPAQTAGLQVGDRIVTINGKKQEDFTKIGMDVSLLGDDASADFVIERAGQTLTLPILPVKTAMNYNMPSIGIGQAESLVGVDRKPGEDILSPLYDAIPGKAKIVAVNGHPTGPDDIGVLDAAIQSAQGRPIDLRVERDGKETTVSAIPTLTLAQFNSTTASRAATNLAGLQPRVRVSGVREQSAAHAAGLAAGDVIRQIALVGTGEVIQPPGVEEFLKWISKVGETNGLKLQIGVERNGETLPAIEIDQATLLQSGRILGVTFDYDMQSPVVAVAVENSSGAGAGIRKGDRLIGVGEQSVTTWHDVINALRTRSAGPVAITFERDGARQTTNLSLSDADVTQLKSLRYQLDLPLMAMIKERQTNNPFTAAAWGVEETKASIFSVYRTIRSLFMRTVPLSNLSGPLGIFNAGTAAAKRGPDWLIWFMALISANLAVVNFLPIPIVDGGLFVFLLAEKITGKPPSPRVQAIAQMVGIALLGTLFLYATYHDILRAFG